jgi:hypothetical protein
LKCEYGLWNVAERSVGILSHYTYFNPLKLKCRSVEMLTFKYYSVHSIWHTNLKALQTQILHTRRDPEVLRRVVFLSTMHYI